MKLQVTDLILVTKEYDRVQENHLLTLEGFLKELAETTQGDVKLQAELLERLFRTKKESSVVWKPENCTLKCMGFSFCRSRQELKEFLLGLDNSPDKDIVFVTGLSSPECMTWLEENGLSPNGEDSMEFCAYEKKPCTFKTGEILRNLNGSDYRVMEKFAEDRLLLMDVRTGKFLVGIGVEQYERHPKGIPPTKNNVETGIEWGHGVYLSDRPSEIDFEALRHEYGKENAGRGEDIYPVEIRETLSRVENIPANSMEEARQIAEEMYREEKVVLDAEDYQKTEYFPAEGKSR
jgi:hypothetical protein